MQKEKNNKKILILYYSQSGQLTQILNAIRGGLRSEAIECDCQAITPVTPYPYPWTFYQFFNVFPESVLMDGCPVRPLALAEHYDLVILGYTVWFLSPSIPVVGFLRSEQARKLLRDTPVITVIGCRDMWLTAQEKMKRLLADLGARLLDNVVLTDQGKSIYTFITTPRWMLTGKKNAFWCFPKAGVAAEEIAAAARFGERLSQALAADAEKGEGPLLSGLGAVNVAGKLIATERIAHRSFLVWSRLMKKIGPPGSLRRHMAITVYAVFLLCLVVTVVPLNMLIRKITAPFYKESIARMVRYYEKPSGR